MPRSMQPATPTQPQLIVRHLFADYPPAPPTEEELAEEAAVVAAEKAKAVRALARARRQSRGGGVAGRLLRGATACPWLRANQCP